MKKIVNKGSFALRLVTRLLIVACCLTVLFPLVWYLYTSVKDSGEYLKDYWSLPSHLVFKNWVDAWTNTEMYDYDGNVVTILTLFKNTLISTVLGVLFLLILTSTVSFILSKYSFTGKKFFKVFFFAAMVIPSILLIIPLYTQLTTISGWFTNNLFVLALIYAVQAMPVQVFLLTKFINNIDNGLLEAARIDGANEFHLFFKIILPCIKPMLFFIALTSFMAFWNEYTIALLFLDDPACFTLSIGLERMKLAAGTQSNYGTIFAGLLMATLPILILYGVFQKEILRGIDMSDGVKG